MARTKAGCSLHWTQGLPWAKPRLPRLTAGPTLDTAQCPARRPPARAFRWRPSSQDTVRAWLAVTDPRALILGGHLLQK